MCLSDKIFELINRPIAAKGLIYLVLGQTIPGQNKPGQNIPRKNILCQNIPDKTYQTKYTGQKVPGQNIPDNIYRTKYT